MSSSKVIYPLYRRYLNGASWFKIESPTRFEEIRIIGSRAMCSIHESIQLPDRNFINDLSFDYAEIAEEISEEAYQTQRKSAI
ncbi:MAG: hypothetical protein ACRCYO_08195 [Bacteroidia bacterium]